MKRFFARKKINVQVLLIIIIDLVPGYQVPGTLRMNGE